MATVWLAHDLRHKRPVAFKVLHPDLAASLGGDRFQREIETAARLQHPHILGVYDSGEVPAAEGRPACLWFTMPYVEGESLRDRLVRERQLGVEEAVRITREVLAALGYAHAHQVIHRDIKPENILLTEEGHVLVADFGIARSLQPDEAGLTQTGMAVGTPAYMSPEQAMGEPLDGRSDLYSTGCVLYEMLVGEAPHTGPNAQAIAARRLTEPVRPIRATREGVPAVLEQVTLKALARTRADRFATAAEFARALGGAVVTPTATPTTPVHVPARFRRSRVAMAGVAVLVALTAAALLARRTGAPATVDGNTIAVAPFDVLAPDLQLWR
jgi:serine/threonine-protein kinase